MTRRVPARPGHAGSVQTNPPEVMDTAIKLRAAQVVIEAGLRAVEMLDVARRLEALEAAVGKSSGMNEATRRRLGALEAVVHQPHEPGELRVLVTYRTFATREELAEHTRKVEADRLLRGHGQESPDTLGISVVSIGDEPGVRDLGVAISRPAKHRSRRTVAVVTPEVAARKHGRAP